MIWSRHHSIFSTIWHYLKRGFSLCSASCCDTYQDSTHTWIYFCTFHCHLSNIVHWLNYHDFVTSLDTEESPPSQPSLTESVLLTLAFCISILVALTISREKKICRDFYWEPKNPLERNHLPASFSSLEIISIFYSFLCRYSTLVWLNLRIGILFLWVLIYTLRYYTKFYVISCLIFSN